MKLAAMIVLLVMASLLSACSGGQKKEEPSFSKEILVNMLSESDSGYDNDDFLLNIKDPQRNGIKEIQKSVYELVVFTRTNEVKIGPDGKERREEGMRADRGRGTILKSGYVLASKEIFWEPPPLIPAPPGPDPPPAILGYEKLEETVFVATFKGQNSFAESPRLEKVFADGKQPFVLLKIPNWENFRKANGIHYFPFDFGDSNNLDIGDYLEAAVSPQGADYVSTGNVGGFTLPDDFWEVLKYPVDQIFTFPNPVFSGDSGSPVIAFENGTPRLVGIVVGYFGRIEGQGFTWGLKINFIAEVIKEKTGVNLIIQFTPIKKG